MYLNKSKQGGSEESAVAGSPGLAATAATLLHFSEDLQSLRVVWHPRTVEGCQNSGLAAKRQGETL
jgi:hypothetical protein